MATVLPSMIENEKVLLGKLYAVKEVITKLSSQRAVGSFGGAIKLVKLPILDLDDQREAETLIAENPFKNSRVAMVSSILFCVNSSIIIEINLSLLKNPLTFPSRWIKAGRIHLDNNEEADAKLSH